MFPFAHSHTCIVSLEPGNELDGWEANLTNSGWQTSITGEEQSLFVDSSGYIFKDCDYFLCYDLDAHSRTNKPNTQGSYYFFAYEKEYNILHIKKSTPK